MLHDTALLRITFLSDRPRVVPGLNGFGVVPGWHEAKRNSFTFALTEHFFVVTFLKPFPNFHYPDSAMKQTSRRRFITTAAVLTGASMVPGIVRANFASGSAPESTTWDLSWLDKLNGKHKQVFDLGELELRVINNWFDAYQDVLRIPDSELTAIVGIARKAFPINAGDDLYRRFPIGERWKLNDPETQKPAMRNIFLDGGRTPEEQKKAVRALQARGTIFWQCNKALQRVTKDLAEMVKRPEAEVYEELKAGLNPGVILIPAHTMLIGLTQERGCAYQALW